MTSEPTRILFVCLGNICRSPLAESVFRHLARERGVEARFVIDSAGTSGHNTGNPPDERSATTARRRGIEITGRARQFTAADLSDFDYVIAMDADNLAEVRALREQAGGEARVHRLREWDPEADTPDVPDPYYGGLEGFEQVHDLVERSCAALLEDLLRESA